MRPKRKVLILSADENWLSRLTCVLKVQGFAIGEPYDCCVIDGPSFGVDTTFKLAMLHHHLILVCDKTQDWGDCIADFPVIDPDMCVLLEAVRLACARKRGPKGLAAQLQAVNP